MIVSIFRHRYCPHRAGGYVRPSPRAPTRLRSENSSRELWHEVALAPALRVFNFVRLDGV